MSLLFLILVEYFQKKSLQERFGHKMCTYFALSANMASFWTITKRKRFFQKRNSRSDFVFEFWIKLLSSSIPVKCFIFNFFFVQFSFCFFGYLSNHLDFCIIKDRIEKWKNAHNNQHLNLQQFFNFLFRYQDQN